MILTEWDYLKKEIHSENIPVTKGAKIMLSFKDKLKSGKNVFGPFWKTSSGALVEVLGNAGFDFLIIDMEHGPHSVESVETLVRAANISGVTPIVRVPENTESAILRPLDRGASGVLVPHVSSGDEARKAILASRFHPIGERGMDIYARSAGYGKIPKEEYLTKANQETVVAIQIEGLEGVRSLEDILKVKGIDVVFIGPYDLSQSMGFPGEVDRPELISEMERMVKLVRAAGMAVGTYVDDPETAKKWTSLGIQFISILVDVVIFHRGCRDLMKELRE